MNPTADRSPAINTAHLRNGSCGALNDLERALCDALDAARADLSRAWDEGWRHGVGYAGNWLDGPEPDGKWRHKSQNPYGAVR